MKAIQFVADKLTCYEKYVAWLSKNAKVDVVSTAGLGENILIVTYKEK